MTSARPASGSRLARTLAASLDPAGPLSSCCEPTAETTPASEATPSVHMPDPPRRRLRPAWIVLGAVILAAAIAGVRMLPDSVPASREESAAALPETTAAPAESGTAEPNLPGASREETAAAGDPVPSMPEPGPVRQPPWDSSVAGRNHGGEPGLGKLLERMRGPGVRTASEFEELRRQADLALDRKPGDATPLAIRTFAEGGEAYARGDDAAARSRLGDVRSGASGRISRAGMLSWLLDAGSSGQPLEDWELAVVYGDVRREGTDLVKRRLREKLGDLRARFGHALLDRIHGRHEDALANAQAVREALGEGNDEISGRISLFQGDVYAELGRWPEAVRAYRSACDAGQRQGCRRAGALERRRRP